MTDQILENKFQVLALCRKNKSPLVKQLEEEVRARYLLQIREEIKINKKLEDLLATSEDLDKAKPEIANELAKLTQDGSEDLLDESVNIIISELKQMRKREPSLYLIDETTGFAITPLKKDDIFTPPKWMDEDGNLHDSTPTVHPNITSSIGMLRARIGKQNRILEKYGEKGEQAFAHLTEPEKIVTKAKEDLSEKGIEFTSKKPEILEIISVGRETLDAELQSVNINFHRWVAYSASLQNKIIESYDGNKVWVGEIKRKTNSRHRWYEISVGYEKPTLLNS